MSNVGYGHVSVDEQRRLILQYTSIHWDMAISTNSEPISVQFTDWDCRKLWGEGGALSVRCIQFLRANSVPFRLDFVTFSRQGSGDHGFFLCGKLKLSPTGFCAPVSALRRSPDGTEHLDAKRRLWTCNQMNCVQSHQHGPANKRYLSPDPLKWPHPSALDS